MREVQIGKLYKHFKNRLYKVIDIVYDCESPSDNLKKVVIYEAMYDDHKKWARDYDDFIGEVDHEKYPEVLQKYRFEEIVSNN